MGGKKAKRVEEGNTQMWPFPFPKTATEREITLTPELQEKALDENKLKDAHTAEPKLIWSATRNTYRVNSCIQLDLCLTAQECALAVGPQ